MGREIRMVPPNWEHPMQECTHSPWQGGCKQALRNNGKCYQPMRSTTFNEAANEWKEELAKWERGERPSYMDKEDHHLEYWEYCGAPPERAYYAPEWPEGSATWFQVYETVSEGTPITPPMPSKAALVDWLCANKDFWDHGPLTRKQAEAFVEDEYAPSLMISGGKITQGMEIAAAHRE